MGRLCERCVVKKSNFWLNGCDPGVFARSQWPFPDWAYQVYRVSFMVYIVTWITISIAFGVPVFGGKYFIFLTNWSLIALGVYGVVAAFSSMYFFCKTKTKTEVKVSTDTTTVEQAVDGLTNPAFDNELNEAPSTIADNNNQALDSDGNALSLAYVPPSNPNNPWYFKLTWILFNINVVAAPIITVVYWSLLHDFSFDPGTDPIGFGINVNAHAINSVLILLDVCVSAYPVRITHFIYGLMYGISYILFSVIYWAAGGTNPFDGGPSIYPILNWEEFPGFTFAIVLGLLVCLVVVQCVVYGLYILRVTIAEKCCRSRRTTNT